jgi:flagellar hook assembly protein FlgD
MFEMENKAEVQVIIYDLKGNVVNELMNANVPAGKYNLTWGGEDEGGNKAESGTYLVSVFVDGHKACSEKVVLKKWK